MSGLVAALPAAEAEENFAITGNVTCRPTTGVPEQPAGNIFVLAPRARGVFTGIDNGYYRVSLRYRDAVNHYVRLQYFASGQDMKSQEKFVGEEHINRDERTPFFPMPEYGIVTPDCPNSNPIAVEPEQAAGGKGAASKWLLIAGGAAATAASALFVAFSRRVPIRTEVGYLPIDEVSPANATRGGLLASERTVHFVALGFRYAGARSTASAIIANPASSSFEPGWEIETNSRVLHPFRWHIAGRFATAGGSAAGFGYYVQTNTEDRQVLYDGGKTLKNPFASPDHAAVGFLAARPQARVAVSVGFRVQVQSKQQPVSVRRQKDFFEDGSVDTSDRIATHHDTTTTADLSVGLSFQARPSLRLGLAAQNLLGSREATNGGTANDRSGGVGAVWFHERLHLGGDVEYSAIKKTNATLGASFIAARNVELGFGYLTTQNSLRVSCRVKRFEYSLRRSGSSWNHYVGTKL